MPLGSLKNNKFYISDWPTKASFKIGVACTFQLRVWPVGRRKTCRCSMWSRPVLFLRGVLLASVPPQ